MPSRARQWRREKSHVTNSSRSTATWTALSVALATGLLLIAVGVRALEGAPVTRPDVDPEVAPVIEEAAQFLSPGARLRLSEIDAVVAKDLAAKWQAASSAVFTLEGCPKLLDWMHSEAGLNFELTLRELRSSGEVEALASLTLIFQLARVAEWDPGFLARSEHAEKLADLLEPWLLAWGERGAEDSLLFEPVLRATLFYGKVMHTAYAAPLVGKNDSAVSRAQQSLNRLVGLPGSRTNLGRVLQQHHPRAVEILETDEDCCNGLKDDCETAFPDLDGECEE